LDIEITDENYQKQIYEEDINNNYENCYSHDIIINKLSSNFEEITMSTVNDSSSEHEGTNTDTKDLLNKHSSKRKDPDMNKKTKNSGTRFTLSIKKARNPLLNKVIKRKKIAL